MSQRTVSAWASLALILLVIAVVLMLTGGVMLIYEIATHGLRDTIMAIWEGPQ